MIYTEIDELPPEATRQLIDAGKVFTALESAQREAAQVRGGMYWHKGPPARPHDRYLVRTTAAGGETSLGPECAETREIYERFVARKEAAESRLRQLKAAMEQHRRLNRALRVGHCDPLVVKLLNQLEQTDLAPHFRVVGTHALYAYEAAAGVHLGSGVLATRDIDLLWDVRQRVRFATQLARVDRSMLAVLRKVDPSFQLRDDQRYTAVNDHGFEVDILRREQAADDPHPVRLSEEEEDFWVVQARHAHRLLEAPAFSALVVATDGSMGRLSTLHPLAFAEFKEWMAQQPDREASRRRRDALQAGVVRQLVAEYLPQWEQAPASEPPRPSANN